MDTKKKKILLWGKKREEVINESVTTDFQLIIAMIINDMYCCEADFQYTAVQKFYKP